VLVADDSELILQFLARTVGAMGHHVVTAGSGQELYQKALASAPDLLIVDVHMPGEGGLEALARLRAHPSFRAVRAIVLSAAIDDALRSQAAGVGVSILLDKGSLDPGAVGQAVERALAGGDKPSLGTHLAHPGPPATADPSPTLDRRRLMAQADDDPELLQHMLALFRKGGPDALAAVSAAVAAGAAPALRVAAHRLKGMLRMLAADQAAQTASCLEEMAVAGELSGATAALATLETQLAELEAELRTLPDG